MLSELGVDADRHGEALGRIKAAGLGKDVWHGLRHCDVDGDNVLLVGDELKLVDFEGSLFGNVLLDVAFLAMAFGHHASVGVIPPATAARFESRYFEAVAGNAPELAAQGPDDIADAKAWLAIECLGAFFKQMDTEKWAPWGGARGRAQAVSQWRVVQTLPRYEPLATDVLEKLAASWGLHELLELPVFDGFAAD